MRYAISSNKGFAPTTFPIIVQNLLDLGIPKDDIFFFEGGHDAYEMVKGPVQHILVPHNSMDFNALLAINELGLCADRWFLLHDTCVLGHRFKDYVESFNHIHPATSLSTGLSMNVGSYSNEYLRTIKDTLFDMRNTGDLAKYKAFLVSREDCFLNPFKQVSHYTNKIPTITHPEDIYNNGVPRVTQYYHDVDLGKTKANWFPKESYELSL